MPKLNIPSPRFLSPQDEEHFFAWLGGIPGVGTVRGVGRELIVTVRSSISEQGLRELIALLSRYKLPMHGLALFASSRNKHWFCNPSSLWFKRVFPS